MLEFGFGFALRESESFRSRVTFRESVRLGVGMSNGENWTLVESSGH